MNDLQLTILWVFAPFFVILLLEALLPPSDDDDDDPEGGIGIKMAYASNPT